jgi:hypothetical protein
LVGFQGELHVPVPGPGERLLLVREQGYRRPGVALHPFLLLPVGRAFQADVPAVEQGLPLDVWGLNRLFSIEDEWGWDRFRKVRLVTEMGRDAPPDDVVDVDIARGRFRVGPPHERASLRVRYHRPYDLAGLKHRGQDALRRGLPLGRSARFVFRDTAPGSTEVS